MASTTFSESTSFLTLDITSAGQTSPSAPIPTPLQRSSSLETFP
eukprot:CAMPEP_0181027124 /NCGR_PEP_ID=MMETSP1070-20121207/4003_1 /TAXON_ID=265543 /ORGANISM="Minutocellus polymorphus, Strain NH13" /LENGTH=43 /DNA_ID= /DNA_START= /DNA_END= /DNA_ORIENTATION=